MDRRELLRLLGGSAIVVPAERFVRRFFPVGIDLKAPPPVPQIVGSAGAQGWLRPVLHGDVLSVAIDPSGLLAGTYEATVTIVDANSSNGSIDVPVRVSMQSYGSPDFPVPAPMPQFQDFKFFQGGPGRSLPMIAGVRYGPPPHQQEQDDATKIDEDTDYDWCDWSDGS